MSKRFVRLLLALGLAPVLAFAQVAAGKGNPYAAAASASTPGSMNYTLTGGSTAQSVQAWMDATRQMPESFGAKADGVTDDTAAILAADAAASSGSTLYISQDVLYFTPGKTYYHATGINLNSNIMAIGAYLTSPQDFNGTAVTYGQAGSVTYNKFCWFPYVRCTKSNYNNWYGNPNSTGIQILNCQNCEFHFEGVANFANGIWIAGQGRGCSENLYFPGLLIDNQRSIRLESLDASGYTNDTTFVGGKTSLSSGDGTNNPFCYSVYIKDYATPNAVTTGVNQTIALSLSPPTLTWAAGNFTTQGFYVGQTVSATGFTGTSTNNFTFRVTAVGTTTMTLATNSVGVGGAALVADPSSTTVTISGEGSTFGSLPNNINFFGTDLEGNAQEAFVCVKGGTLNSWHGCRFETSGTPTMMFLGMGALAPDTYNNIYGGYVSSGLDFTVIQGAAAYNYGNTPFYGDRLAHSTLNTNGYLVLSNTSADTNSDITIFPAATTDAGLWKPNALTTWTTKIGSAYSLDSKPSGITYPTTRVSSNSSGILLGDGSATPVSYLKSLSLNNLDFGPQGNEALKLTGVTTQVDYLNITGAATANPATVTLAAAGSDSNVNLKLTPLGTGNVQAGNLNLTNPATSATLALAGSSTLTTTGAYSWAFTVPGAYTYTLPSATSTLARSDAAQTFTGVQTFSATDVHTLGETMTASAGVSTAGYIGQDSTQKAMGTYQNGVKQMLSGTLFTQTATGTNGANTAITNILGTGVGTAVLPASFSLVGKTIRVHVIGTVTTAASPGTTVISLYLNAGTPVTVVASPTLTLTASMTSMPFACDFYLTFQSTTTVMGGGNCVFSSSTTGITGLDVPIATTTAATIVAATSYTINVSATNGTAGGTVYTSQISSIEVLN